jgi:hypothetical protein
VRRDWLAAGARAPHPRGPAGPQGAGALLGDAAGPGRCPHQRTGARPDGASGPPAASHDSATGKWHPTQRPEARPGRPAARYGWLQQTAAHAGPPAAPRRPPDGRTRAKGCRKTAPERRPPICFQLRPPWWCTARRRISSSSVVQPPFRVGPPTLPSTGGRSLRASALLDRPLVEGRRCIFNSASPAGWRGAPNCKRAARQLPVVRLRGEQRGPCCGRGASALGQPVACEGRAGSR